MAKKPDITTITSGYCSRQALNSNFENLRAGFDNTLSLDGSTPNAMHADLDMNNNDILNINTLAVADLTVAGSDVNTALYSAVAASAANAVDSAASAVDSAVSASSAALYDGPWLDDVATLLADTTLTLTPGQPNTVVIGDYVRTRKEGFSYEVVASGGDVTTAGGIQLGVLAGSNGTYPILALAPNADGTTDDKAKIDLLNQSGFVLDLGGKNYEYGGVWAAVATVINGKLIDDNRTYDYRSNTPETVIIAPQTRWRANYYTGTSLQIHGGGKVMMGGFRFFGNYQKAGRVLSTGVNGFTVIDSADGQDLGAETTRKLENWYAVFSVANNTDETCQFKFMPYLRAQAVAGSVVTLGQAGEGKHVPLTATTYAWADDTLNGVDCLVINQNAEWSGRVTTITDCTNGSVTLADATGIVAGDFILPAPPGFSEYAWVVDHYMDTYEWRNIADTGLDVGSIAIYQGTLAETGAIAASFETSFAGYVSPLATQAIVKLTYAMSTASTGVVGHYFWHDSSNHETWSEYSEKTGNDTKTVVHSSIRCPFSKKQATYISSAGTLEGTVIGRTLQISGWCVP